MINTYDLHIRFVAAVGLRLLSFVGIIKCISLFNHINFVGVGLSCISSINSLVDYINLIGLSGISGGLSSKLVALSVSAI